MINLFINISFYDGDIATGGSSFWEFAITTFVAVSIPLTVFYLQTKSDREKENRQKEKQLQDIKQREDDTLKYFISLLKSVIKLSKKQVTQFNTFGKNLIHAPFSAQNRLMMVIAVDLERILHKLDHEIIFHAYVKKYGNSDDTILNFQKIFNRLDFLEYTFSDAIRVEKIMHDEMYSKKLQYLKIVDEKIVGACAFLGNNLTLTGSDPQLEHLLSDGIKNYYNITKDDPPISDIQYQFINPFKVQLWNNYRGNSDIVEIVKNCREVSLLFSSIEFYYTSTGKEFITTYEKSKKTIEELIELGTNLYSKEDIQKMKDFSEE